MIKQSHINRKAMNAWHCGSRELAKHTGIMSQDHARMQICDGCSRTRNNERKCVFVFILPMYLLILKKKNISNKNSENKKNTKLSYRRLKTDESVFVGAVTRSNLRHDDVIMTTRCLVLPHNIMVT